MDRFLCITSLFQMPLLNRQLPSEGWPHAVVQLTAIECHFATVLAVHLTTKKLSSFRFWVRSSEQDRSSETWALGTSKKSRYIWILQIENVRANISPLIKTQEWHCGWLAGVRSSLPFLPFPHAPSSDSPGLRAEWERSLFSPELFCQVLHQWWTLTQWDVETWAWDPRFVPRLIGKHKLGKASSHSSSSSQSNIWGSSQQPNPTSNVGYWFGWPLGGKSPIHIGSLLWLNL